MPQERRGRVNGQAQDQTAQRHQGPPRLSQRLVGTLSRGNLRDDGDVRRRRLGDGPLAGGR